MNIDLHIHTTASDGRLTPSEVVGRAASLGMKAIAVTDHDSLEGIEEALSEAQTFPELLLIPGVEMGASVSSGEMHVLGYFVDHRSEELCARLRELRDSRVIRVEKMIANLDALGLHIDLDHVERIAAGASLGRPHVAQALLDKGHVASFSEAFDRYIGRDGLAFAERNKLTPIETVNLITRTGGLAVLAHPAKSAGLDELVEELKPAGLVGMEVFYKDYDRKTVARLGQVASRHGLIPCGGSDFHGFEADGNEIGRCDVPQQSVDRLMALRHRP